MRLSAVPLVPKRARSTSDPLLAAAGRDAKGRRTPEALSLRFSEAGGGLPAVLSYSRKGCLGDTRAAGAKAALRSKRRRASFQSCPLRAERGISCWKGKADSLEKAKRGILAEHRADILVGQGLGHFCLDNREED